VKIFLRGRRAEEKEENWRKVEVMSVEKKRKPSFSVNEISVIRERVRKNLETIQSKLTNSVNNWKKCNISEEITNDVKAVGMAQQEEVKESGKISIPLQKKNFLH